LRTPLFSPLQARGTFSRIGSSDAPADLPVFFPAVTLLPLLYYRYNVFPFFFFFPRRCAGAPPPLASRNISPLSHPPPHIFFSIDQIVLSNCFLAGGRNRFLTPASSFLLSTRFFSSSRSCWFSENNTFPLPGKRSCRKFLSSTYPPPPFFPR